MGTFFINKREFFFKKTIIFVFTFLFITGNAFAIAPPNTPVISSPLDTTTHVGGEFIIFSGSCSDPGEDGTLSGSSLVWTSSKEGEIGIGQNFSTNSLRSGTHIITLTATDSESLSSFTNISIDVTNNAPTSTISLPSNNSNFNGGDAITFSGAGTDIDTDDTLSYSWSSTYNSVTTVIGTGSVISVNTLQVGTHVIILTVDDGQGGSTPSTPITLIINNNAPTAGILSPTNSDTFYLSTTINFNGTGNDLEDPVGLLTYDWSCTVHGQLSTASAFTTSTIPEGFHTIFFTVTDSQDTDNIVAQSVDIHVGNYDPVANITSPSTGTSYNMGQVIIFQGTGIDTEDDGLTGASLVWTSNLMGATPIGTGTTFTRDDLPGGTHVITMTASDTYSTPGTGTDSIIITVNNTFPTSTITTPVSGSSFYVNSDVTFSGIGDDAEDGSITGADLVWDSTIQGNVGTGSPLTINTLIQGSHSITLIATDSTGASTTSPSITVNIGNTLPTATITSPTDGSTFNRGDIITFRGNGIDNEDGTLPGTSLSWASNIDSVIGPGTILPVDSLVSGTHTITLTVTDSQGEIDTDTIAITVSNNAPSVTINSPPDNSMYDLGISIILSATATDQEDGFLSGASVSWSSSLDGNLGNGTSISTSSLSKGSHQITFSATDSEGATGSATITIHIGNTPPTVSITSPVTGTTYNDGDYITFQGTGLDAEDGTLSGLSLEWTSNIGGQFATGDNPPPVNTLPTGQHTITLIAKDNNNATTYSTPITIRVGNTEPVATILNPSDNSVFETGQTITFDGTGIDSEDGVLLTTYLVWTSSREGQIGTGSSVSLVSLSSGEHTITLTVTDLDGATGTASITIKAQNALPVATIAAPATGSSFDEGNSISFQGSATDIENGDLTGTSLEWSSNLDGIMGTGANFATELLSAGTHNITLTATDDDGSSSTATVSVTIIPMTLSQNTLSVSRGSSGTITISGGKSPYRVATRRSHIAMPLENNGTVNIEGISAGSTIITVTDNNRKSAEVNVTVTDSGGSTPGDTLPIAYAGEDLYNISENSNITLSGSNTNDPDGEATSYIWVQTEPGNPSVSLSEPTVELSDPTSATPYFLAPLVALSGNTISFQLRTYTQSGSDTDEIVITLASNGITDYPPDVIAFKSPTDKNMGIKVTQKGVLKSLNTMAPSKIKTGIIPQNMLYGLIDMKITTSTPGATVAFMVHFPEAIPAGYTWFKYIVDEDTWVDFDRELISSGNGDGAVFSADRKSITIYITDDSSYDDNKADSIIEDPAGIGIGPLTSNTGNTTGNGDDDSGGCFINTVE